VSSSDCMASDVRMMINNEVGHTSKQCWSVLSWCPGRRLAFLREATKTALRISSSGRGLNPVRLEYEAGIWK
jgi:hypothetical protein